MGNGGFSVRTVGVMRRLIRRAGVGYDDMSNEDALFARWCARSSNNVCRRCPPALAAAFCLSEADSPGERQQDGGAGGRAVYGFHNRFRHCWRKRSLAREDVEVCYKPVCEAEAKLGRSYWLPRVVT